MTDNDGVSLANIRHPRSRFWWLAWLWYWFFPPKLDPGAIETIEIELKPAKGNLRGPGRTGGDEVTND